MYIQGFVLAVKADREEDYRRLAEMAAGIFKEHGATRVVEAWEDDVPEGELTSFPMAVKREPGEKVVFSWIEYPDRATAERSMQLTMEDERMSDDTTLHEIMSGARMIWGGFRTIVDA